MITRCIKLDYDNNSRPISMTVEEEGKAIHKTISYDKLGRSITEFQDGCYTVRIRQTVKYDSNFRLIEIIEEEERKVGNPALPRGGFF